MGICCRINDSAALMFSMIILFLRLTGKRGVRQLSIFELAIILSLGSIAGDPMFTEDLPLVHALVVMTVVIGMYRLTTWLMMKYQPFEDLIEGKSLYIVENGELVLEKIKYGKMSHDRILCPNAPTRCGAFGTSTCRFTRN